MAFCSVCSDIRGTRVHHRRICPRLPLAPGQERMPSLAIAEMRMKLNTRPQMAPSLEAFARRVFNNQAVMAGGDDLWYEIYRLYSEGMGAAQTVPGQNASKFFFQSIAQRLPMWINQGFLQNEEVSFREILDECSSRSPLPLEYTTRFLYFELFPGPAKCRLYLNVGLDFISVVAHGILKYVNKTPNHGLLDFKIAGPAAVLSRRDVFVVYFRTKEAAQAMGQFFLTPEYAPLFRPAVPEMTSQLANGIGVSTGAEPVQQKTGMGLDDGKSFGTIRSELIAMAMLNFNENRGQLGNDFETFKRFVCLAFKSYGLDPMNPGD